MPRKRPWLFDIATTVSLLMLMCTVELTVRTPDLIRYPITWGEDPLCTLSFGDGQIEFGSYHLLTVFDPSPESAGFREPYSASNLSPTRAYPAIRYLHFPRAGFQLTSPNARQFIVGPQATLPYWTILFITAIMPALAFFRAFRDLCDRKTMRLLQKGICPRCGYDLRATPGRCPECGRAAISRVP